MTPRLAFAVVALMGVACTASASESDPHPLLDSLAELQDSTARADLDDADLFRRAGCGAASYTGESMAECVSTLENAANHGRPYYDYCEDRDDREQCRQIIRMTARLPKFARPFVGSLAHT